MKLKDKQTLHTKTIKELTSDLDKSVVELTKLKLDLKTNQLKDTTQLKKLRHKIAVIKTIIHNKPKKES